MTRQKGAENGRPQQRRDDDPALRHLGDLDELSHCCLRYLTCRFLRPHNFPDSVACNATLTLQRTNAVDTTRHRIKDLLLGFRRLMMRVRATFLIVLIALPCAIHVVSTTALDALATVGAQAL